MKTQIQTLQRVVESLQNHNNFVRTKMEEKKVNEAYYQALNDCRIWYFC